MLSDRIVGLEDAVLPVEPVDARHRLVADAPGQRGGDDDEGDGCREQLPAQHAVSLGTTLAASSGRHRADRAVDRALAEHAGADVDDGGLAGGDADEGLAEGDDRARPRAHCSRATAGTGSPCARTCTSQSNGVSGSAGGIPAQVKREPASSEIASASRGPTTTSLVFGRTSSTKRGLPSSVGKPTLRPLR